MAKQQIRHLKGLKQETDHLSINLENVPHASNFFYADKVTVKQQFDQIVVTFANLQNPDDIETSLCVQIVMPLELACLFLYKSNFIEPSLSGEVLSGVVSRVSKSLKDKYGHPKDLKTFKIPADPSLFRKFSSNFSTSALIQGQSCIEFFQIPPSLLIDLTFNNKVSRDGGVNHVISIIASPMLHDTYLESIEEILKPHYKEEVADVLSK